MPRLVEMQEEYAELNVQLLGITDAQQGTMAAFTEEHHLNFPLLANAPKTREAFGVNMVWGSTHYLMDPSGKVVAKGLDAAQERLDQIEDTP
jgi:peroxiredoxin